MKQITGASIRSPKENGGRWKLEGYNLIQMVKNRLDLGKILGICDSIGKWKFKLSDPNLP